MLKSLPIIRQPEELLAKMDQWRKTLAPLLKTPPAPQIPFNFKITECRGGNQLSWARVDGADGYEITRTDSNDFSGAKTITIEGGDTIEYFDSIAISGASLPKIGYKLRATAGTAQNKHSVKGKMTYPVFATPLDPSDSTSAGTTHFDKTTDKDRAATTYKKRFQ